MKILDQPKTIRLKIMDFLSRREHSVKEIFQKADDKLNMMADVSDKMTIPQVREYIRRYRTGEDVNKYLKQFKLLKPELDELQKLAARRTS